MRPTLDLSRAPWLVFHDHLPQGFWLKAGLVGLTWLSVFVLSRLTTRFFDLVDRRLTLYNVPERRLAKLDFLVDLFLILVGAFVTLFILGVGQAIWGAVALTSIAGVIVALAAQQLGQNLLAGIMILFERPFVVGDAVEMDERVGRVTKVTLHSTTLLTPDGLQVLVPNSRVLNAPITNFTAQPERRITITIDVLEGKDLAGVEAALCKGVETEEHLRGPARTQVFLKESLDEGNRWEVRYWVDRAEFGDHCLPSAMGRLVRALDDAGLETAMPARHLFVENGG